MIDAAIIEQCAGGVAVETVQAVIEKESNGNAWAININGQPKMKVTPPNSKAEAIGLAAALIKEGYSIDVGLMQVNSKNFTAYGLSVDDAFDVCKNIKAGSEILSYFYNKALYESDDEQSALKQALSAYNTGSFQRGFSNGYVQKYYASGATDPAHDPFKCDTRIAINIYNNKEATIMTEQQAEMTLPEKVEAKELAGVVVEMNPDEAEQLGAFEETALSEADAYESATDEH